MNGYAEAIRALNAPYLNGRFHVRERLTTPRLSAERVTAYESRDDLRYRVVKVGQANKPTHNGRIYPAEAWGRVIGDATVRKCPHGILGGAIDHVGHLDGGNLRDKCILWHSLAIDAAGDVTGEFEIVTGHSRGRYLQAWIDAGGAVGFSTFGNASAHEPTPAERRQYGLADDEYAVVMDDFDLLAIDVVDHPSVDGAWWIARQ